MANKVRLALLTRVLAKADRWLRRWGVVADLLDLIYYLRWVVVFVSTLGGAELLAWGASVGGLIGGQAFLAITALIIITAIGIGAFRPQVSAVSQKAEPRYREYDGVRWQDRGRRYANSDELRIDGPFCIGDDYTTLSYRDNVGKVYPAFNYGLARVGSRYGALVCTECGKEYLLGDQGKTVQQSLGEVTNVFEGVRRGEIIESASDTEGSRSQ